MKRAEFLGNQKVHGAAPTRSRSVAVERDRPVEISMELLNIDRHSSTVHGGPFRLRAELKSGDEGVLLAGETMSLAGEKWETVSATSDRRWLAGELELYKVITVARDTLWIYDVFLRRDE